MKRQSESGVTLMEMLISVVLLSFLSVGILFASYCAVKCGAAHSPATFVIGSLRYEISTPPMFAITSRQITLPSGATS